LLREDVFPIKKGEVETSPGILILLVIEYFKNIGPNGQEHDMKTRLHLILLILKHPKKQLLLLLATIALHP
jgi:hypothetical protein